MTHLPAHDRAVMTRTLTRREILERHTCSRSELARTILVLLHGRQRLGCASALRLAAPHVTTVWTVNVLIILCRDGRSAANREGFFALLTFFDSVHSQI